MTKAKPAAAEAAPDAPTAAAWRIAYTTRAAEIADVYSLNDGGGNKFLILFEIMGNDTPITVIKYNPAGAEVLRRVERPPQGTAGVYKANALNVVLSGADLEIWICGHEAVSGERNNSAMVWRLPGVAVPYPAGQQPTGAFFNTALLGGTSEPPPSSGLTKADVQAAVHDEMLQLVVTGQPPAFFQRLASAAHNGAVNAITEAHLLTAANMGEAFTNGHSGDLIYGQMNNVAGSQAIKILVEFGIIPPSAIPRTGPHAWPRGLPGFPWGQPDAPAE